MAEPVPERVPSREERNNAREFRKNKTLTIKCATPPEGQPTNLKQAKKHLDACKKWWGKWEELANDAIGQIQVKAEYDDAVAKFDIVIDENSTWLILFGQLDNKFGLLVR